MTDSTTGSGHEVALFFNAIFVIDALRDGEPKTGETLYDEVISPMTLQRDQLHISYRRVRTAAEWDVALSAIAEQCTSERLGPILHIEAHGDEMGLQMPSDEHIPWEAMRDALARLNRISRFNLFVVLGACDSAYLVKTLSPTTVAPMWGMLAETGTPTGDELLTRFRAFYGELLQSLNGQAAFAVLRAAAPMGKARYVFLDARSVFKMVYQAYFNVATTPEALKEREDTIVRTVIARSRQRPNMRAQAIMRRDIRKKLQRGGQREFFEQFRRRFFMLDDFPQNEARFPLSFEECLPSGRLST